MNPNTKIITDHIKRHYPDAFITRQTVPTPRDWVFIHGVTLEQIQDLFVQVQVSVVNDNYFAFPADSVAIPQETFVSLEAVSSQSVSDGVRRIEDVLGHVYFERDLKQQTIITIQ